MFKEINIWTKLTAEKRSLFYYYGQGQTRENFGMHAHLKVTNQHKNVLN
jgi:hypothetical protein